MIAVADVDSYTSRNISQISRGLACPGSNRWHRKSADSPHPTPSMQLSPCSLWGSVTAYAVTAACVFCMRGGVSNQWAERVGCGPVGSSW